jgi:hypothetical protein
MAIHETPTRERKEYLRGGPSHPFRCIGNSSILLIIATQIGDSKEIKHDLRWTRNESTLDLIS